MNRREFIPALGGAVARPDAGLSEAGYERTRAMARRLGIYDGVVFHQATFAGKPAEMSERDYIYDVSIATDYALALGVVVAVLQMTGRVAGSIGHSANGKHG